MKGSRSFAKRLSLYVVSITAVLFTVTMLVVGIFMRSSLTNEAEKKVANLLNATVGDIESILSNVEAATTNSIWIVKEHLNDPDYIASIPKHLVEENQYIVGSTVAFVPNYFASKGEYYAPYTYIDEKSGQVVSMQMGNEDYTYPTLDWFQIPYLLRKAWWSEPYYDDGGGKQMMITYSVPIKDDKDNVIAIITADVSLNALTKYAEAIKPYKDSYVMLISANASFISHPDSAFILNETIFSAIMSMKNSNDELMQLGKNMVDGKEGIAEFSDEGIKCFAAYGPVMNGWSMAIICTYADVLAQLKTMVFVLLAILIVGLALLIFLSRRIIRKLTQPLSQFSDSAMEIAQGNFNAELPKIESKDEMMRLHDSFEYMQTSLTNYIAELKTVTSAKQRIESELYIAREIQLGMVPKNFTEKVHALLFPAKEVGGDLYDFVEKDGCLYFTIGDVSGKGIPAALYMAVTRSSFRSMIGNGLPMNEVAEGMNSTVCDGNDTDMFVTFFVAKLDLSTGHMEYCNGGHNAIIIAKPDGTTEFLHAKSNLAAGVMKDFPYQCEELTLPHGSHIVLYTDGVSEAEKENKEQYGDDRLLEFVSKVEKRSVEQMANDLIADVRAFVDGAEQNDDITIMTISFK